MWTKENKERLLGCKNDHERMQAFPGIGRDHLRRIAKEFSSDGGSSNLSKIAELLRKSGIDPDEVGRVEKVRVGTYQMLTKDNEGEAQIHDLEVASLVLSPAFADGPAWPVIEQAAPISIPPVTVKNPQRTFKTAVFLSDPHVGFYNFDGELVAFHDDRAMNVALQVIRDLQPDLIINGGDSLDLAEWSLKFAVTPEAMHITQPAIDRFYRFLCEQKLAAPNAEVRLLEGNHDRRLMNFVSANAKAALRIRQADSPKSWPVLSVPFLLRLNELDVNYVDGYPACWTRINDNLIAVHGHKVRSSGSTAQAMIDDERISVVFGHIHRHESAMKTRRVLNKDTMGRRTNLTQSFGCLCHIDGRVPSTRGATDLMGRPIPSAENWQQGFGVIHFIEGDGPFDVERVYINDGLGIFRGKVYASSSGATPQ